MKRFLILLSLLCTAPAFSQDTSHEKLHPLAPFVGTWQSQFDEKTTDVSKWQWILGGKAIRIMHSINEGAYGGESIIQWNTAQQAITYHYITTSTFYTEGKITPIENGFEAHEMVFGNMGGITETKSGYSIKNGDMHVWSQFLKDGEWTKIDRSIYKKAPDAKVVFK